MVWGWKYSAGQNVLLNSFGLFVNRFIFFLILSTFFYDVFNKTLREKHHGQSRF